MDPMEIYLNQFSDADWDEIFGDSLNEQEEYDSAFFDHPDNYSSERPDSSADIDTQDVQPGTSSSSSAPPKKRKCPRRNQVRTDNL
jgi:hypothetical protein